MSSSRTRRKTLVGGRSDLLLSEDSFRLLSDKLKHADREEILISKFGRMDLYDVIDKCWENAGEMVGQYVLVFPLSFSCLSRKCGVTSTKTASLEQIIKKGNQPGLGFTIRDEFDISPERFIVQFISPTNEAECSIHVVVSKYSYINSIVGVNLSVLSVQEWSRTRLSEEKIRSGIKELYF